MMIALPRWFHTLFAALLLAGLGAAWVAFAPLRFGGQASYVIVSGISMEPNFRRGDLAILRQDDDYAIGDVVTYRHPTIGPVIHRIIGRDGDHFIFKGDNNAWIDEYRPVQTELIGKLWMYLPAIGTVVEQLRIPRNMAVLVAVMGAIVMTTGTGSVGPRERRRGRRSALWNVRLVVGEREPVRQTQPRVSGGAGASRDDLLFILATVACAALLLGVFAFLRPSTRSVSENIGYQQAGTWSYSAAAPAGLYDNGAAQTGDPLFRRSTSSIAIHFAYQLSANQPVDAHGTYGIRAEIADVSGWKRTIELQPATAFSGNAFAADATLDLARVQALIDTFEQQTGTQHPQYDLAIVPDVQVQGRLAGQALADSFAPRLMFQIDGQALRFQNDTSGSANALQPTKPGLLKQDLMQPNALALLGLTLDVLLARRIAVIVLALALGGVALLVWRARGAQRDEMARIQRKYGALLIAVSELGIAAAGPTIDVATIDDLARLAERGGHMILRQIDAGAARYVVQDGGVCYRYQVAAPAIIEEQIA